MEYFSQIPEKNAKALYLFAYARISTLSYRLVAKSAHMNIWPKKCDILVLFKKKDANPQLYTPMLGFRLLVTI